VNVIDVALVGAATGLLGGLFGKGGSAVATPLLVAAGVPPMVAVAAPLPATVPATLAAASAYHRSGAIDPAVVRATLRWGVPATVLGALGSRWVGGPGLVLVTEVLLLLVGIRLLLGHRPPNPALASVLAVSGPSGGATGLAAGPRGGTGAGEVPGAGGVAGGLPAGDGAGTDPGPARRARSSRGGGASPGAGAGEVGVGALAVADRTGAAGGDHLTAPPSRQAVAAVAVLAGALAGLLANSGGFLLAPLYLVVLRLPVRSALGSSLVAAAVLAVPGTAVHAALGHVDWSVAGLLACTSIPLSFAGARLALRIRPARLERLYGFALVALGAVTLLAR
jgi:uncharacterized membrane protein YfcA